MSKCKEMLSPYQNFLNDTDGKFIIDLFMTGENKTLSQRIQFNDEEFDLLVEFLEDMFPPKSEGKTFEFNVDSDTDYEIKPVKNEAP